MDKKCFVSYAKVKPVLQTQSPRMSLEANNKAWMGSES